MDKLHTIHMIHVDVNYCEAMSSGKKLALDCNWVLKHVTEIGLCVFFKLLFIFLD